MTYSNVPVCCPSRASLWSGRHAHHIGHEHNGIAVRGAWNNYEGVGKNYTGHLIGDVLGKNGYDVRISGKTDWKSGSHSMNVRLQAWSMYARFPYDIPAHGGWRDEGGGGNTDSCGSNGTVAPGNKTTHGGDWNTLKKTTAWIRGRKGNPTPFFAYQGMNIVHPPYVTNERWFDAIDPATITVPAWPKLSELHPCDLQASMKKACTPSDADAAAFYSEARRKRIRRIYYAMIAEFDAMVGAYVDAVDEAGLADDTVFLVVSDHGDMQMEHQQYYKMVPYEASARVPMLLAGAPLNTRPDQWVEDQPTQLLDIYPTLMDLARVPQPNRPAELDGYSLLPLVPTADGVAAKDDAARPPFVVSQFHGDDVGMSWFMVRKGRHKLIVHGTGNEVPAQLFDTDADPGEYTNLYADPAKATAALNATFADLDADLRSVVDYPAVARDVADYGQKMFAWWAVNGSHMGQPSWERALNAPGLRWDPSWDVSPTGSLAAIKAWRAAPAQVLPCLADQVYPPKTTPANNKDAGAGAANAAAGADDPTRVRLNTGQPVDSLQNTFSIERTALHSYGPDPHSCWVLCDFLTGGCRG